MAALLVDCLPYILFAAAVFAAVQLGCMWYADRTDASRSTASYLGEWLLLTGGSAAALIAIRAHAAGFIPVVALVAVIVLLTLIGLWRSTASG